MTVIVVTPPDPVVYLDDAKAHLHVDHTDDDVLITAMIEAATARIDGPTGWLGRSLGPQTLELRLDAFPCTGIPLPYGPVIDVDDVTYVDSSGALVAIAADQYELLGTPIVAPVYGVSWPTARCQPEAVSITYQAGFDTLPAPIRAAILLMVGDLYENREGQVIGQGTLTQVINPIVQALLAPYRVVAL